MVGKKKRWVRDKPKDIKLSHRKNWQFQVEGYFKLRNEKTGRIWTGKGFSKTFRNLKKATKHHKEAKNDALFYAGGTNWKVLKSSYRTVRWRKIKCRKKKKKSK